MRQIVSLSGGKLVRYTIVSFSPFPIVLRVYDRSEEKEPHSGLNSLIHLLNLQKLKLQ